MKHKVTPRAFVELKIPHNPRLSADGTRAVFEVTEVDFDESRYVSRLWMADVEAGKSRQITFSYEGERNARWSPDNKHIAFLSSRPDMTTPPHEEDEEDAHKEQLWIMPTGGGEARRLTHVKEGIKEYLWLPDSESILFLTEEAYPQPIQFVHDENRKHKVDPVIEHDEKRRKQFWEVSIEEGKPELVFTGDFGVNDFDLSPDGKNLAFTTNHTGDPNDYDKYDLFVLEMEDGAEPRMLTDKSGGKFNPQWSPDASQIAYLSVLDATMSYSQECIWTIPAEGGEPANLFATASYDAQDTHWSKSGGSLYASVSDRTTSPIIKIKDGEIAYVTAPDNPVVCTEFHVGASGAVVAILEDNQGPPELYVIENGEKRALTEFGKSFKEQFAVPRVEVIRWQTDIGEIEGVLTYPPDYEQGSPLPLIVQVHGGPKGHSVNTLRNYYQPAVWAAEGYLVLSPNFRGSEGYGNAFAIANRRDLGGGDYRDIMAGVDLLIEQELADPKRLGIMGGSYGGYMANWAIGHTDRFAAAISMFGIFNIVTDYSNSELSRWDPEYMGAYYWEDPEIYRQCSPSTYLENIKTPVLIMHGESDSNTFISNSKEMYQALRARGVTAKFVHYPREGHGVREPHHKLDEMRRCLAWFDKYLKGGGEAQPLYRIGDKIEKDGYELHVLRAEDADYPGWTEEDERLLDVAISLASKEPVESSWTFELNEIKLLTADGKECTLRGVPVDFGGGRSLVEGENLTLTAHPDKDTGRLGVAPVVTFVVPDEGGTFTVQLADFPPVGFSIGTREKEDEKTDGDDEGEKVERGDNGDKDERADDPSSSS